MQYCEIDLGVEKCFLLNFIHIFYNYFTSYLVAPQEMCFHCWVGGYKHFGEGKKQIAKFKDPLSAID